MKKLFFIALTMIFIVSSVVSVSAASAPYTTLEDAVAAIALDPLNEKVVQDSIEGSDSFANEECFNLFDNNVETKFCTGTLPLYASWKMDKAYLIGGIIFATANDNASYNGRNPETWTLSGSADGKTWVELAAGTEGDFEEENFTYYYVKFDAKDAYEYFKFDVPSSVSGTFQVAELILCEAEAPIVEEVIEEEPVVEETPAETTAPVVAAVVTAPQTSDSIAIIAVIAVIALAGCVILKKRTN